MVEQIYDAFISYNHGADGELARALRSNLQRFAKPWNRRRAMRVFLDRDSLEATSSLGDALDDKLGGARYLILLASNESAASPWCDREARYWLEHRGADSLLLVLTDAEGSLAWDSDRQAFDPASSPSLPPSLIDAYGEEPLWQDLRWVEEEGAGALLDLREPRFRSAVASLAATIHGIPKDELDGEDVLQHRKFSLIRRVAIGLLSVLTILAAAASVIAFVQADRATENARIATLRQVSAAATAQLGVDLETGLLLAVEANQLVLEGDEATSAGDTAREALLLAAYGTPPQVTDFVGGGDARVVAVAATDGRRYSAHADGTVRSWVDGDPESSLLAADLGSLTDMAVGPSGEIAVLTDQQLIVVDPRDGSAVEYVTPDLGEYSFLVNVTITPEGSVVMSDSGGDVWRWQPGGPDAAIVASSPSGYSVAPGLAVAPDGAHLFVGGSAPVLLDMTTSPWTQQPVGPAGFAGWGDVALAQIDYIDRESLIGVGAGEGSAVVRFDLGTGRLDYLQEGGQLWQGGALSLASDGSFIAGGSNPSVISGRVECFDADSTCRFDVDEFSVPAAISDVFVTAMARHPDNSSVLLGTDRGNIIVWNLDTELVPETDARLATSELPEPILAELSAAVARPLAVDGEGQSRGPTMSPSGAFAAAAIPEGVLLLDIATGSTVRLTPLENGSPTFGWAFSADERQLFIVGGIDPQPEGLHLGTEIVAMNVETGQPFGQPIRFGRAAPSPTLAGQSESGDELVIQYSSGPTIGLPLTPGTWEREVCARAGGPLAADAWRRLLGDAISYEPSCLNGTVTAG